MAYVNLTVQMPDQDAATPAGRKAWLANLDETVTGCGQITAWAVEGIEEGETPPLYDWVGWEAETAMTGDGSGDPEKFSLTIRDPAGEEYALIAHRTEGGQYPLDGDVAEEKVERAIALVAALNADAEAASSEEGVRYPVFTLDLGVDDGGGRLCAVSISPFWSRDEVVAFAESARGVTASVVKERALKDGRNIDSGEGDLSLPVVGATLITVSGDAEEDADETDLY